MNAAVSTRGRNVEEKMSVMKNVTIASMLVASLGFASVALAANSGPAGCIQKQKEFAVAVESAQPGAATDQAREVARSARSFCSSAYYDRGVSLYNKALALLGKN
jgi:hypothetical protein